MKVFINGRFLTQRLTGVQRFAIEIVKALDTVVGPQDDFTVLIPPEEAVNGLDLKNIKRLTVGKLKGNAWVQFSLPAYAMRHKGKLLTLSGLCPIAKPDFWTVHDITFIRHPESFDWKFRVVYKLFYRWALPRCEKILTVSRFSKMEIANQFGINGDNIEVVYNSGNHMLEKGVLSPDVSKFGLTPKGYYLSVSSRNRHKNQRFITELANRHPEKRFVIAGGSNRSFNKVGDTGECNVVYTGYVSDSELAALYQCATGFIFPSLYEGFGIPPMEAIMLGCQFIALSDIPVFREIYEDAYFFDPNDPSQFSFEEFEQNRITDGARKGYAQKYSYTRGAKKCYGAIFGRD